MMTDTAKAPVAAPGYDLAGVPLTPRAHHLLELEFGDRKDFAGTANNRDFMA